MSYSAGIIDVEDVPEDERPYNEWCSVLMIEDYNGCRYYSDSMEPEDATFYRDLSWIVTELERAYRTGQIDALETIDLNE